MKYLLIFQEAFEVKATKKQIAKVDKYFSNKETIILHKILPIEEEVQK